MLPDLKDYYVDVRKVAKWVYSGDEWAISFDDERFEKEPHPKDDVVAETCEIFDMFLHLQRSDISGIPVDSPEARRLVFNGFDGNNDDHYHIAQILIDDLERYVAVRDGTSNSHSVGTISKYRTMVAKHRSAIDRRAETARYGPLTLEDLNDVVS